MTFCGPKGEYLMSEVDFFSLEGCIEGMKLPEDEEEMFVDAVAAHVMGKEIGPGADLYSPAEKTRSKNHVHLFAALPSLNAFFSAII